MKNTIVKKILITLAAALVAFPVLADVNDTSKVMITNKETGTRRAEANLYIRTDSKTKEVSQVVMGSGEERSFKNARYLKKSTLIEQDGLLRPVRSNAVYYNKKDQPIGGYEITYNYDDKIVTYVEYGEEKKETLRKAFEIQGPICDAQNLPLFLSRFLILHENLVYEHFYLLSVEPRLYKVQLYYRGKEDIEINGKKVPARKLQLIGDMGPVTELAAKFLPKTFIWLTPKPPYQWLKYEGLENGPDSANVVVINDPQ